MDTTLADPLLGQLLDRRYRIDRRVARGGMATVYSALDTRLDRTVAIKVMHPALAEDPDFVERFHREAKAAARLSHPGVVAVFDQGDDAGRVFLVMEYVEGRTLRELLSAQGRLRPARAVAILESVLAALDAAHRAGLVHRDVKPENVLLAEDGRVKVADFGLARAVETGTITATVGLLIGTVGYLAPEQVASGAAGPGGDVYAAGILLFEMLTGIPPYAGESPLSVAYRHVHEDVPAPATVVAGIPPALDALTVRATRRDPAARPSDAGAFLDELRRAVREPAGSPAGAGDPAGADTVALARPAAAERDTVVVGPPAARPTHPNHRSARSAAPNDPPAVRSAGPDASAGSSASAGPNTSAARAARPRRSSLRRGTVLAAVLALLTLLAILAGWWVGSGRYTSAPSVLGKNRLAAESIATQAGVRVRFGEPAFSETVPVGLVVQQRPEPRGKVRRNGTLTAALSKGPERYPVPTLTGKSLDAATRALADRHLRVGSTSTRYDDVVPQGAVVTTEPPPGAALRPDTTVALVLSRGIEPVSIPDVAGAPVEAARATLARVRLSASTTDAFSDTVPTGAVISSDPPKGATVDKGSTIALTVSKGPDLVAVPRVGGMKRADAKAQLSAAGFTPRDVTLLPAGPDQVLRQDPPAARMARRGSVVTVYVF